MLIINTSVRGVMTSSAMISLNSNTPSIISRSEPRITPVSSPSSTKDRISSSETFSSRFSPFIPNSLSTKFVDTDKSFTNGFATTLQTATGRAANSATASDFCKAIRFGTSSPSTKVKYDKIKVMITTAISVPHGMPKRSKKRPNSSDIPVAADALEKNPANVMAT